MSNKTILQNHNEIINNNNLSIDDLIESINNLPEASGEVVEPTLQEKTVTPTTSTQTITPDSTYDGLSQVIVSAVTSSIDSDIKATNIRKGIDILGVTGTMEEYVAPSLQSKTVSPSTSSQTVKPDSGYDGLSQVTVNAMTTATQATPSITVSSSGLITASATQTAGYVSAGTKSATKQLTTKGATTYTPKTTNQTIASGTYLTGTQTIKGDSNLVASNIKSGVSIFGVTGTMSASEDLSDELTTQTNLITTQETTIDSIITALQGKAAGGTGSGESAQLENVDCTISTTVSSSNSQARPYVTYLTLENGKIVSKYFYTNSNNYNATIQVLKGSYVHISTIYGSSYAVYELDSSGDLEIWSVYYDDVVDTNNSNKCIIAKVNGTCSISTRSWEDNTHAGGSID